MLNKKDTTNAIKLLKLNKVIILPTDTIYGLSAICNKENEIKINNIKKSDEDKKLIILFSKLSQLKSIFKPSKEFKKNLKSEKLLTQVVDTNNGKLAFRKVIRKDLKNIINKVGLIFSTSVNYSGNPFLGKKEELELFNIQVSEFFWDGPLNSKPSKIIDLVEKKVIRD
ncbi:Sua5/YciO/YrdC/YwlC family protein [Spiroplasma monobiae]|uniref:L-threonylcarbamoyladenylate synthase n=1 Tax=Spiroplasma monobiae MQ-1 TaxID=1336748 RepID=A0A2K9LV69_SPISQ|nr:Sua5/YciO/YrdC/YwlC family protein [Spiroplasma monobiae]AUM62936.1 L-threonylcarbamoyladenylate synthase [Spiroplasma monobiae MQ-1]